MDSSSINIILLAPEFLPVWGGVGTYVVELARNLPKDICVHIVTPKRDGFNNEGMITDNYDFQSIFSDNVKIHFICKANDTFLYNAKFQYACFKHLPEIIKNENIDLIHTHTAQMPDILFQLRNMDVPVVTTLHTTIEGQRRASKNSGLKFSELEFSEKATFLLYPILASLEYIYHHQNKRNYIAVSEWTKNQVTDAYNINPSSIEVIHNGVNTSIFNPTSKKRSYIHFPFLQDIDVPIVLFNSRLIGAKGFKFLFKAIPQILDQTDVHFVFTGNNYIDSDLPKNSTTFLGYIDYLKMPYLYSSSDIFILTSLYENFPMSILESMASGTATIATKVGGVSEVIKNERNGLLIPSRSIGAIANRILELAEDDYKRKIISKKAKKDVERRFNLEITANKTANVYKRVIS